MNIFDIKSNKACHRVACGSLTGYGLAALSGLCLALSFPGFGMWPLVWVAFVPFWFAIKGRTPLASAGIGIIAGIFYFGPPLSWVRNTMIDFGHMPIWSSVATNFLMVIVLSLYMGLFAYLVGRISLAKGEETALALSPFIWIAVEYARGHLPHFGFPWLRLADSQFEIAPIIQVADLTGADGVTFVILFVNAAIYKMVASLLRPTEGDKATLRWPVMAVTLLLLTVGYGFNRIDQFSASDQGEVKVCLLQGNIDQSRKWDPSYLDEQLGIYLSMSATAVDDGADLLIWPETAAPFYFGNDIPFDNKIYSLSQSLNVPILFGSPAIKRSNSRDEPAITHNRAWIVKPDGSSGKYDKVHLVPFGEYVPFQKLLSFVEKFTAPIGDLRPGTELNPLNAGNYSLGVQICFEIVFPGYSRELVKNGAGALVNITNDSWFGDSPASKQSLSMAVFRAVENRTPLLRAAQSGVSAIVTPAGKITGKTGLFRSARLIGGFTPRTGPLTFYTLTGDLLAMLCSFITLGAVIVCIRKDRSSNLTL